MAAAHYFDPSPNTPSDPGQVELSLPGFRARLRTDRGVFSHGRIDRGTLVLLREASPPVTGEGADLLDLGCGYGPIACWLATFAPSATVWAVDVNDRALELAAANAAALGLNLRTARPEQVPPDVRFAGIWSNPPARVGKDALHEMLERWLVRLAVDASAWVVVHRHLGSDSLAAWLASQGWSAERVASKKGYRVLKVGAGPGSVKAGSM